MNEQALKTGNGKHRSLMLREYNPHLGSKDEVILANMGLVRKIANKYRIIAEFYAHISLEDLISEGTIGLLKAFDQYDPTKFNNVNRFSTYATPMIRGAIQRFIRDKAPPVKASRDTVKLSKAITRMGLIDRTPVEIAEQLDCTVKGASLAQKYTVETSSIFSVDVPFRIGEDKETSILDSFKSDADYSALFVREFLGTLTERERYVVIRRLAGRSQHQIATEIGRSQGLVMKTIRAVRTKLKTYQGIGV
ncbi:sigma-70 family RNA polymerase sigma factor [Paenibacillus sp. P26]|nr:sigma-70 family RNA polymerase sigma factor [Paenibacillus sp. P26]UUZ96013.1 sigma-70 family RNA polymerase sigma factor [Paenibacillus sp. P25]